MKTLITGGAGFIGSHLASELLEQRSEVVIFDNFATGSAENLESIQENPRLSIHEGDILEASALEPLIRDCDKVFHLAAAVGVRLILERPVETIMTNVRGTENVLELARKYSRKVLIASTSEVYGKNKNGPLREEDDRILGSVTKRRWAYANTKTLDEFLALAYHHEWGLPIVIVRLFNTVGPRQIGHYGMVIPNFIHSALEGEPIVVYGSGRQSRCFSHVHDVVQDLVALMDHPGAVGEIVNVGNDEETTIEDLAHRVKKLSGSASPISYISYEEAYGSGFEDMERRVPDLTKLRSLVGNRSRKSLDEILNSVIDHLRVKVSIR